MSLANINQPLAATSVRGFDGEPLGDELLVLAPGSESSLTVPGGTMLLGADFINQGPDLLLVGADGSQILIAGYFSLDEPPQLVTETGLALPADLVARLAGGQAPGQYAQVEYAQAEYAQAAPDAGGEAVSIGQVTTADGLVTATRLDGTVVELSIDSPVFQGDIIETGPDGTLGIVFADGSSFGLGESGRMVLDRMVYDPDGGSGEMAFSLVQGVFAFVSGQIPANNPDAMTLRTPALTLSIRGTEAFVKAAAVGENNGVTLKEGGPIEVCTDVECETLIIPGQTVLADSPEVSPSAPAFLLANAEFDLYGPTAGRLFDSVLIRDGDFTNIDPAAGPGPSSNGGRGYGFNSDSGGDGTGGTGGTGGFGGTQPPPGSPLLGATNDPPPPPPPTQNDPDPPPPPPSSPVVTTTDGAGGTITVGTVSPIPTTLSGFEDWQGFPHTDPFYTEFPSGGPGVVEDGAGAPLPMEVVVAFIPDDNEEMTSFTVSGIPDGARFFIGGSADTDEVTVAGGEVTVNLADYGGAIPVMYLLPPHDSDVDIALSVSGEIFDPDGGFSGGDAGGGGVKVLTFEGLANSEAVTDFYDGGQGGDGIGPFGPDFNITFSPNTLALIDSDAGGTGNIGGEPSPDTIAFFLTGTAIMNVPDGFDTGFSFFYSAINQGGTITVYDGLDGTGNVLVSLVLPVTISDGGDPNGDFSPFFPFGVEFDGVAMSVDFGGTVNQIGFDDITLGSATPGAQPLIIDTITGDHVAAIDAVADFPHIQDYVNGVWVNVEGTTEIENDLEDEHQNNGGSYVYEPDFRVAVDDTDGSESITRIAVTPGLNTSLTEGDGFDGYFDGAGQALVTWVMDGVGGEVPIDANTLFRVFTGPGETGEAFIQATSVTIGADGSLVLEFDAALHIQIVDLSDVDFIQPEHSDDDVVLEVAVISTETPTDLEVGVPWDPTGTWNNTATRTWTLESNLLAVADTPTVSFDFSAIPDLTEPVVVPIVASFPDTDGSETHTLSLTIPSDWTVDVANGWSQVGSTDEWTIDLGSAGSYSGGPAVSTPDAWSGTGDFTLTATATEDNPEGAVSVLVATATVTGSAIIGTSSGETLTGGSGDDVINGDEGDDDLTGGQGDDYLVGGIGADTFHFTDADTDGNDTIGDFGDGADTVDLDILFDSLGINDAGTAAGDRADLVVLDNTSSPGDTILTIVGADDFSITFQDVDLGSGAAGSFDVGDLAPLGIIVGDET